MHPVAQMGYFCIRLLLLFAYRHGQERKREKGAGPFAQQSRPSEISVKRLREENASEMIELAGKTNVRWNLSNVHTWHFRRQV